MLPADGLRSGHGAAARFNERRRAAPILTDRFLFSGLRDSAAEQPQTADFGLIAAGIVAEMFGVQSPSVSEGEADELFALRK